MPQQKYSGLSQFADAPSFKALSSLAGGERSSGGMRPGLRNAIEDEAGEELLRGIRSRKPTVFNRAATPGVPGVFGEERQEFYNPATDDPIAAAETNRRQQFLDIVSGARGKLAGAEEIAGGMEDLEDFGQRRDLRRYYEPGEMSRREGTRRHELERATGPARIAAQSRESVAGVQAAADIQEATLKNDPSALLMKYFPTWASRGGFGIDARTGRPQGAPPDIQDSAAEAMRRMLGGQGGPPPAGPAAPGGPGGGAPPPGASPLAALPPNVQQRVQQARQAGYSDEEIIADLQRRGIIR